MPQGAKGQQDYEQQSGCARSIPAQEVEMILSARFVKSPQSEGSLFCDDCGWLISGSLIRLYGMGDEHEKPYTVRLHVGCTAESMDVSQEPKIERALRKGTGDNERQIKGNK